VTAEVARERRGSALGILRGWMRDRPLIPLFVLLAALVLLLEVVQPGIVTPSWASNTMRFAVPLAILAACQTMTMLTGGIDLVRDGHLRR
jgi:ribose transport system permease protein